MWNKRAGGGGTAAVNETRTMQVLVVEDDPDIRGILRAIIEEEGYCAEVAENGKEALRVLRQDRHAPELILLDLMMPVMSGWELLHRIREDERLKSIPVAIISAVPANKVPSGTRRLRKPLDLDHLFRIVSSVCGPPSRPFASASPSGPVPS